MYLFSICFICPKIEFQIYSSTIKYSWIHWNDSAKRKKKYNEKSEFHSEMKYLEDQIKGFSFLSQGTGDEKILQKRHSHRSCDAFTSSACESWLIQQGLVSVNTPNGLYVWQSVGKWVTESLYLWQCETALPGVPRGTYPHAGWLGWELRWGSLSTALVTQKQNTRVYCRAAASGRKKVHRFETAC